MLSEAGGDDVGTVVVAVDPAEERVRVGFCDGCERIAEGETDRDDRVVTVLDERLKVRATVFFGDGFKFVDGNAEIGGRIVGAKPSRVVERAVAERPPVSNAIPRLPPSPLSSSSPHAAAIRVNDKRTDSSSIKRLRMVVFPPGRQWAANCFVSFDRLPTEEISYASPRVSAAPL